MRSIWVVLLVVACAKTDAVCEAGRQVDCACGDGSEGFQVCADDGSAWGDCACDVAEDTDVADTDVVPLECTELSTCDACLDCTWADDTCSAVWAACTAVTPCPDLVACLKVCGPADATCINQCYLDAPGGEPEAGSAWSCATTACEAACL